MGNPFFTAEELARLRDRDAGLPDHAVTKPYSLQWLRRLGRPVCLFGGGGFLFGVKEALAGVEIRCCLDNAPDKWGRILHGLPVRCPEEAAPDLRRDRTLVVISMADAANVRAVTAQCQALGLDCVDWFECWRAMETPAGISELAENPDCVRAHSTWEEKQSRDVFRAIVRYRTTLDPVDMPDHSEPQYFIPAVEPRWHRHFIDAGAYDGDTLREFLTRFRDAFVSYHAFEPSPDCAARLRESAGGDPRIVLYPFAVSDSVGRCRLSARGTASSLTDDAGVDVETTSLDAALAGLPATYLKMDVEGAELSALRGAEGLIRRERPVLGISAYHQPDHLWRVPEQIRALNPGYRLLLRHHSRFISETVCYALP